MPHGSSKNYSCSHNTQTRQRTAYKCKFHWICFIDKCRSQLMNMRTTSYVIRRLANRRPLDAAVMRSCTTWYFIHQLSGTCGAWIQVKLHKIRPVSHPHPRGRTVWYLLWGFWRKWKHVICHYTAHLNCSAGDSAKQSCRETPWSRGQGRPRPWLHVFWE